MIVINLSHITTFLRLSRAVRFPEGRFFRELTRQLEYAKIIDAHGYA